MNGTTLTLGLAGLLAGAGVLQARGSAAKTQPRPGRLPRMASLFSGGGLVEVGLAGLVHPVFAVEISPPIAAVYAQAIGPHVEVEDVRHVTLPPHGQIDYLHASPVCKSYSAAKLKGGEHGVDMDTAAATAAAIHALKPRVFTLENVPKYAGSEALKLVESALRQEGYEFDEAVYRAEDYGCASRRKRLLLRAVRSGRLPPKPEPTHGPGRAHPYADWFSAIEGDVERYEDDILPRWMIERLARASVPYHDVPKPLLVMGGSAGKNLPASWAGGPAPTFKATPGEKHRVLLPGGRVKTLSPLGTSKILGLPSSYPLPAKRSLAVTILGNGVPPALSRAVFGPLMAFGGHL